MARAQPAAKGPPTASRPPSDLAGAGGLPTSPCCWRLDAPSPFFSPLLLPSFPPLLLLLLLPSFLPLLLLLLPSFPPLLLLLLLQEALDTALHRTNLRIGRRYIEVFPSCRGDLLTALQRNRYVASRIAKGELPRVSGAGATASTRADSLLLLWWLLLAV